MKCSAQDLLIKAEQFYDDERNGLISASKKEAKGLFTGGARWMRLSLEVLRGETMIFPTASYELLGCFKYTSALLAGVGAGILGWIISPWSAPLLFVLVFYAVEAQFVFIFPLFLDRSAHPFRESFLLTKKAGGTIKVMQTIIPIAIFMLLGGFIGKGFLRSWCIGCLGIVIWYEKIHSI